MTARASYAAMRKVSIGFNASLKGPGNQAASDLEVLLYRNGMFPREVWSDLVRIRGDGKKLDDPLSLSQYSKMVDHLRGLKTDSVPSVDVQEIPEWVLESIKVAEERDLEFGKSSQTDAPLRLKYVEDMSRVVLEGKERVDQILPYQLEGAMFGLKRSGRCLIADEMGLGKTLQAIMLAYQYVSEWPLLIICPSSLRFVWREQLSRWLGGLIEPGDVHVVTRGKDPVDAKAKIVIVPYILLEPNPHLHVRAVDKTAYRAVICDESHYIKDPNSKRSKAVLKILKKAKRIVLLSGTPSMNNAEEMYMQTCQLLASKPSLTQFRERYCERSEFRVKGHTLVKYSGAIHREELNALLVKAVMIRRMKTDVLSQLPEKLRTRIDLDVARSIFAKKVQDMTSAWLNKGKETAADYGIETMELWRLTGQAKLDAVRDYLTDFIAANSETKFIIFAHHKFMLDGLEQMLLKTLPAGGYMRIDGEVNQTVRAASVTRFQQDSKCKAALLSVTSCAEGITLTAASVVIFCELYWVPGLMEQAEARAHRVGQKDCVMCMYLVMPDSPDEVIFNMLEKKKKDTSLILDGCESGLLASSSQQPEDTSNKLVEELSVEQMASLLDSDWEPVKRRKI